MEIMSFDKNAGRRMEKNKIEPVSCRYILGRNLYGAGIKTPSMKKWMS
jgi:hypothetical protein